MSFWRSYLISVDELSGVETVFDRLALVVLFDDLAIYLSSQVNFPATVLEDRLAPSINTRLDDTKRFKSADWGTMSFAPEKGKLLLSLNQGLDRVCMWLRDESSAHQQKADLRGGARFGVLSAFSSWPLGFAASECPARNASTGQVPTPNARTAPRHSGPG